MFTSEDVRVAVFVLFELSQALMGGVLTVSRRGRSRTRHRWSDGNMREEASGGGREGEVQGGAWEEGR